MTDEGQAWLPLLGGGGEHAVVRAEQGAVRIGTLSPVHRVCHRFEIGSTLLSSCAPGIPGNYLKWVHEELVRAVCSRSAGFDVRMCARRGRYVRASAACVTAARHEN